MQNQISLENNQADEGKILEVLVEGETKNNPERLAGRTRTNKLVVFAGPLEISGQIVRVKITKGRPNLLEGELVLNSTKK